MRRNMFEVLLIYRQMSDAVNEVINSNCIRCGEASNDLITRFLERSAFKDGPKPFKL